MSVEVTTDIETQKSVQEMRVEAASQLKSARELAKKVRAEAVHELEDARSRVKRIATREEEMAARWAKLLEAEQKAAETAAATPPPLPPAPAPAPAPQIISTDAPELIAQAQAEAAEIVAQAAAEARAMREEAMRLLGMAEGEKAESHEIAQSETEKAMSEAERLRAEAETEAQQLREDAKRVSNDDGNTSIYSKRGGRKLPRIGEGATSVLSQMSDLRAKSAEDEDRKVV